MKVFDNVQRYWTKKVNSIAAQDGMFQREINEAMHRFKEQDWGDVSKADVESNNEALVNCDMVLGAYETSHSRIWVIAESSAGNEYDRLTVLFPDEY